MTKNPKKWKEFRRVRHRLPAIVTEWVEVKRKSQAGVEYTKYSPRPNNGFLRAQRRRGANAWIFDMINQIREKANQNEEVLPGLVPEEQGKETVSDETVHETEEKVNN